ncbi:probable F-box protein At5g04010 [Telopea speciosissima]|uniref:probable F-box protein At5g04010 n=1 Tax=Telopea speciosissima TaxID=54955 RepID=UPI001CC48E60|nr:probable F-box protein At5g04010 [Telopea speciosissima]
MASCVCKSWSIFMSSDHLWKPICFTHYPSLSSLSLTDPTISYCRLYALAHQSTKRRYPSPPRISLDDLVFAVDIFDGNSHSLSLANAGKDLDIHRHGVFRFEVDVQTGDVGAFELSTEMKVTWTIILKGWKGIFSMMECKGKGRLVSGCEQWFMEDLPAPGCCLNAGASGLAAELGLGFSDGTKIRVEKVSMGIMNVGSCRYFSVDEDLRYLQHFLLPDL